MVGQAAVLLKWGVLVVVMPRAVTTVTTLSVTEPKTKAIATVRLSRSHPPPRRYPISRIPLSDTWTGALRKAYSPLGGEAIGVGFGGLKQPAGWEMKRELLSRRATTHWDEIVEVRA